MTVYYLAETEESYEIDKLRIAGGKARVDVLAILGRMGFDRIDVRYKRNADESVLTKLLGHFRAYRLLMRAFSTLKTGDSLIVQFPLETHTILIGRIMRHLANRGVKTILLVHDLEMFRFTRLSSMSQLKKLRMQIEEREALEWASRIIVHNDRMQEELSEMLNASSKRMVKLNLFDYLTDWCPKDGEEQLPCEPVIIAGNLARKKAGYIYCLPSNQRFNLFGTNLEDGYQKENVLYQGSFSAEELPSHLVGSFGLVWDGPSNMTCEGTYGGYLRINNPHKTSLYLASGIPVIIWSEAALAGLVTENGVGFTVGSLDEINDRLQTLSNEDYQEMRENARRLSVRLRSGYYTKRAVTEALED